MYKRQAHQNAVTYCNGSGQVHRSSHLGTLIAPPSTTRGTVMTMSARTANCREVEDRQTE
jgi:hypothetical protein